MRSASKVLVLGMLLVLIPAAAWAQGPTISPIGNVTLNAGVTTVVNVVAVDPNGDAITLSVSGASFATLNAPTTGNGLVVTTLTIYPLAGDVGAHTVTITATAGSETDTETLDVIVNATGSDQSPVVVAPANQTVNEGQILTFTVTATDAEAITSLSVSGQPSGAAFTPGAGNTSGTFTWTPSLTQAGSYEVTFTAANGLEGQATTHIQVNNVTENHPPDVTAPATLSVNEGAMVSFTATATDVDADHVTLTATGVPSGATFTDNGNNTATFTWTPGTTAAGTYTITVTGDDGHGGTDTAVTALTVVDVGGGNTAPVLTVPATRTVNEGATLTFDVSATDANGDTTNLTASGLPTGATFVDHDNNTGTFTWMPATDQAGTYTVRFAADDGHGGTDTDTTVITVLDVTGGGEAEATAKVLGKIHRHRKFICFKVRPVNDSFDPADTDLSSITLNWNGASIDAMSRKTHINFECEGDDHDDDDDGDCGECDRDDHDDAGRWGDHRGQNQEQGSGNRRQWADRRQRNGEGDGDRGPWDDGGDRRWSDRGNPGNDDGDGNGHDCDEDGDDDGDDDDGNCVASGIHACFSMSDLRDLFGDESLADNIEDATISGDLTTGGTFVATINYHHAGNGHGKDKNKRRHGHGAMNVQATPNPFNPQTVLTFTLAQPARVRVNIYDLRGALVKTLLNENRHAGTQTVPWDGTDSKQKRVVSGIYFVQVQSDRERVVQRLTVLK